MISGPRRGRGWGGSFSSLPPSPHFFKNYRVTEKRVFSAPPPSLWVTNQPPPPFLFQSSSAVTGFWYLTLFLHQFRGNLICPVYFTLSLKRFEAPISPFSIKSHFPFDQKQKYQWCLFHGHDTNRPRANECPHFYIVPCKVRAKGTSKANTGENSTSSVYCLYCFCKFLLDPCPCVILAH